MMKKQLQPNKWSCLPTAFAIALDMPIRVLIEEIGHDGSEILWPKLPEPYCRRSFNIRELIDVCYRHQYAVIQIDATVISFVNTDKEWSRLGLLIESKSTEWEEIQRCYNTCHESAIELENEELNVQFEQYLGANHGVLIGMAGRSPHAVAWDGKMIIDPCCNEASFFKRFKIRQFCMIRKME